MSNRSTPLWRPWGSRVPIRGSFGLRLMALVAILGMAVVVGSPGPAAASRVSPDSAHAPAAKDTPDPPPGGFNWKIVDEDVEYLAGPSKVKCTLREMTARYPAPDQRWIRYKWSVSCSKAPFLIRFFEPWLFREGKTIFYKDQTEGCFNLKYCQLFTDRRDPKGRQEYQMIARVTIADPNGAGALGKKFKR